jgi:hydrogenase-1 operon protein HyaF
MQNPGSEAHIINFSLLPMSPADMDCLDAILGPGNSGVFSRGYGKCRIMATSLANVWRVQYFNGMNSILLDTLEITRIPEVALASEDDLADSLDRLQEAWQWLQGILMDGRFEGSYLGRDDSLADTARMECKICWWVYDPAQGDDVWQIPPGTPFSALPEHWRCPVCDGARDQFMVLDSPA